MRRHNGRRSTRNIMKNKRSKKREKKKDNVMQRCKEETVKQKGEQVFMSGGAGEVGRV